MFISTTRCFGGFAADRAVAVRGRRDHWGDPYRTTLQSWKYTMPAFLVPFAFVLDPSAWAFCLRARSRRWQRRLGSIAIVNDYRRPGHPLRSPARSRVWALERTNVLERRAASRRGLALVFSTGSGSSSTASQCSSWFRSRPAWRDRRYGRIALMHSRSDRSSCAATRPLLILSPAGRTMAP